MAGDSTGRAGCWGRGQVQLTAGERRLSILQPPGQGSIHITARLAAPSTRAGSAVPGQMGPRVGGWVVSRDPPASMPEQRMVTVSALRPQSRLAAEFICKERGSAGREKEN